MFLVTQSMYSETFTMVMCLYHAETTEGRYGIVLSVAPCEYDTCDVCSQERADTDSDSRAEMRNERYFSFPGDR